VRLSYFTDTDTLDVDLTDKPSVDSGEVADGVVLDFDASGNVGGVETEKASSKVVLGQLLVSNLPGAVETAS
jgi:uncharacterized protein YuzE